jgi:putative copper export protein
LRVVFYFHLLGATVWVGGLIVLGALVPAVRKVTDDREVLRAMARRFAVLSWTALGVQVVTGAIMILDRPLTGVLMAKIGLVLLSAMLAAWHTVAASEQSAAVRGAIQGTILILALAIVALAILV